MSVLEHAGSIWHLMLADSLPAGNFTSKIEVSVLTMKVSPHILRLRHQSKPLVVGCALGKEVFIS